MKNLFLVCFSSLVVFLICNSAVLAGSIHEGIALYKSQQYQEAIAQLQEVLNENPNDFHANYYLGVSYYKVKEYDKAINPLKKASEINAQEFGSSFYLGECYRKKKDSDFYKAAEAFEKAAVIKPDDAPTQQLLAICYMSLKKWNKAEDSLKKAIKAKPSFELYFDLGQAYYNQQKWSEASLQWQEALKLKPADHKTAIYLSKAAIYAKDFATAEKNAQALLAKDASDVEALNLLADAQIYGKKYTDAISTADKILALNPKMYQANVTKGQAYENTSNFPKAIESYQKAVEKEPNNCDYVFLLGHAYELNKEDNKAKSEYEKSINLCKNENAQVRVGFVNDRLKNKEMIETEKAIGIVSGEEVVIEEAKKN